MSDGGTAPTPLFEARLPPQLARVLTAVQASLPLQVALVLALHHLLSPRLRWAAELPQRAFLEPTLAWPALQHPPFQILLALIGLPLLLAWRSNRWETFADGGATRLFTIAFVGVFAWQFSLYDPNLLLGQTHALDRLLLVALAGACWLHPGFVFPFLLWLSVILAQISFPLPASTWHWPDKRLPFDALVLFSAFLVVRSVTRPRVQTFAFLALCLTGATYSHAAISKLSLGPHFWSWPLDDNLANVSMAAYLQVGWLGFLSPDTALALAGWLGRFAVPMALGTIAIELGGFALLLHRRACALWLAAFVAMHAMIWATTGIFFWKWIVFDVALLAYVWKVRRLEGDASSPAVLPGLDARVAIPLALAIMLATRFIFYNVDFAWYDSALTNGFELRARGESGREYRLDPRFFAPYDILFTQGRFYYLLDERVLAGTYGTVRDHALMVALDSAKPEDLPELKRKFGVNHFNPNAGARFARVVTRQVESAMARGHRHHPLHFLAAPYHFQRAAAPDTYDFQEPIRSVEVRFEEWLYTGDAIHRISDRPVLELPIRPVTWTR